MCIFVIIDTFQNDMFPYIVNASVLSVNQRSIAVSNSLVEVATHEKGGGGKLGEGEGFKGG